MKRIKRFNEDVNDGSVIDQYQNEGNDFQTSVFSDIEGDLDNMSPDEAEDYLLSIIAFCNQQLQGYKTMED